MSDVTPTTKYVKDVLLRKCYVQLHEVLREFAKDNGAPDNFTVKVLPDEMVEFTWEIDKKTLLAEDEDAPAPEPYYDSTHRVYRVATGDIQEGDLVMVKRTFEKWNTDRQQYDLEVGPWLPEVFLPFAERGSGNQYSHYMHVPGTTAIRCRNLTDEERAQIKRI